MTKILQSEVLDKLPVVEIQATLHTFMEPVLRQMPEKRLQRVAELAVQGILGGQSPLVTQMARGVTRKEKTIRPMARRLYRLMWNRRFSHRELLKGLYGIAQRTVAAAECTQLIVALDQVNFEKPYARRLEGLSTVIKSTPPGERGQKRLTSGYPALTATVVNLDIPVVTYANWFSYTSHDFVSENQEIYRAIRTTCALFPDINLRFVGDAGLDDQKIYHWVALANAEFIIRACHNRTVEVYNDRLDRWEEEALNDLVNSVYFRLRLQVAFNRARKVKKVEMDLGWLKIRLPKTQQVLWVLVAHNRSKKHDLVLLTNVPILTARDAQTVYTQWRFRPRIEHTYRFDQEGGLDVERMGVRTLERMRRIFVLLLIAALFVYHTNHTWPRRTLIWLRRLGGQLGLPSDLNGPYVLLAGIRAVLITAATLAFALQHPCPHPAATYG